MSYRSIEDHNSHFVFHHDNGHEIRIAKKGLSDATLNKIKGFADGGEVSVDKDKAQSVQDSFNQALGGTQQTNPKLQQSHVTNPSKPQVQRFDDGGRVQDPTEQIKLADTSNLPAETPPFPQTNYEQQSTPTQPDNSASNTAGFLFPTMDQLKSGVSAISDATSNFIFPKDKPQGDPNVRPANDTIPAPQEAPSNVPLGQGPKTAELPLVKSSAPYEQAYNTQKSAIENEAQHEGELGQQQANVYQQQQDQQQQLLNNFQEEHNNLQQEGELLKQDILNNNIDPKKVFNDMGTGQKFMTGIGLILGGFGGGLQGRENPAMTQLNRLIDNDINAQKTNLGKKENLLQRNMQEQGNLRDAMSATRLQMMTVAEAQLQKNLALAKTPQAQAAAQMAIGKLQMEMAPIRQDLALKKAALQQMGHSGQQWDGVARAIKALVPKEDQKEAYQNADRIRYAQEAGSKIISEWDKMNKENTIVGRVSHAGFEPASVGNWENLMLPLIKDKEGRVNEFEFDTTKKFKPNPGDTRTKAAAKRAGLEQFIRDKESSSLLTGNLIPIPKMNIAKPIQAGSGYQNVGYKK